MKRYGQKSNSIFSTCALTICAIAILYSKSITNQKNIIISESIPKKMRAGSFFTLKKSELENYSVHVGTQLLTSLDDKKVYLGAVSLDTPQWTQVWGWKKSENNELEWFGTWIEVEKPPLSVAKKLRIPASVIEQLDSADSNLVAFESKKMQMALSRTDGVLKAQCYQKPIKSLIVSQFASPRTLPSGFSYYHTGVDMRAALGTPIYASGDGEVVFAEKLTVPGNTVIVYHGGGLYSQYKHLSKIEVQPGDKIIRGHKLGLSGATGRVEAPHLHWEFYWKGNPTDPLQLLQVLAPICDQS